MKKIQDTLNKTTMEKQQLQRKLGDALKRVKVLERENGEALMDIKKFKQLLKETQEKLVASEKEEALQKSRVGELAAALQVIRDTEAARIAGRREFGVQVEIEPEKADFCTQTNFSAPPATLRQHNNITCHPAYQTDRRPGTSSVMARPDTYPVPRSLSQVRNPL